MIRARILNFYAFKKYSGNRASGRDLGRISVGQAPKPDLRPAEGRPETRLLALTRQNSDQNPVRKRFVSENFLKIRNLGPLGLA